MTDLPNLKDFCENGRGVNHNFPDCNKYPCKDIRELLLLRREHAQKEVEFHRHKFNEKLQQPEPDCQMYWKAVGRLEELNELLGEKQ